MTRVCVAVVVPIPTPCRGRITNIRIIGETDNQAAEGLARIYPAEQREKITAPMVRIGTFLPCPARQPKK